MGNKIDWNSTATKMGAEGFYEFSKANKFSILKQQMGFGKTAMMTYTCGLYAKALRESGVLSKNQPLNVIIIAPKNVIKQQSWEETFDDFNCAFGDHYLKVSESLTPAGLSTLKTNESLYKNKKEIIALGNKTVMDFARKLAKKEECSLEKAYEMQRDKKAIAMAKTLKCSKEEVLLNFEEALVKTKRLAIKSMRISEFVNRHTQQPTLIVIDEVQDVKNCKSQGGKALKTLLNYFPKALGASAQPAPNNIMDTIGYAVYNDDYSSYSDFMKKHITEETQRNIRLSHFVPCDSEGKFIESCTMDILSYYQKISNIIYAPTLPKDFVTPTRIDITHSYDLTENSERNIKKCLKAKRNREYESVQACISDIREIIAHDPNHLLQIPAIFKDMRDKKGVKIKQPLIFYRLESEIGDDPLKQDENDPNFQRGILWALSKGNIPYHIVNGSHDFKPEMAQDTNHAIVIQYQSGGAGLNFPYSNMTIFYGLTFSWKDLEQAQGRNLRRNQSHDVYQYFVHSTNASDMRFVEVIQSKKKFTSVVQKRCLEDIERDILSKEMEQIDLFDNLFN